MKSNGAVLLQRMGLRTVLMTGALRQSPIRADGMTMDPAMAAMLRIIRRMPLPAASDDPARGINMRAVYEAASQISGLRLLRHIRTEDMTITGGPAPLPARRYLPPGEPGGTLVYFHGGGFAMGSLQSHDRLCRVLADRTGLAVFAVEYRLAPECKFPAAADDAASALAFAARTQPGPLAVGGDSAGGQLAAACLLERTDIPVRAQLLFYPLVDIAGGYASEGLFGEGYLLTIPIMASLLSAYVPSVQDRTNPRLSPLRAGPRRVPAVVVAAGFDPLRDQARAYARALEQEGVPVRLLEESGLIHGFADFAGVVPEARRAVLRAADALRELMAGTPP